MESKLVFIVLILRRWLKQCFLVDGDRLEFYSTRRPTDQRHLTTLAIFRYLHAPCVDYFAGLLVDHRQRVIIDLGVGAHISRRVSLHLIVLAVKFHFPFGVYLVSRGIDSPCLDLESVKQ